MNSLEIKSFYDPCSHTLTYVVFDQNTKDAIIIDPVLDYDASSGSISLESMNELLGFINKEQLIILQVLETHVHADHLTAALEFKRFFPNVKVGIGEKVLSVQKTFKQKLNLFTLHDNGSQFDFLFKDGEELSFGSINVKIIATPGHTPACVSYLIEDMLFTGDTLFMPDSGTGRCDFPDGSAEDLYNSVHEKLYKLPDETRVFVGHDYQPKGRELLFETTIGESKKNNFQLSMGTSQQDFVHFRIKRDATLNDPKLLLPSILVNLNGGCVPDSSSNGVQFNRKKK
jgi:glyoxylase-like metal-dependent hydrolase (beta-lactamase superfamily II)